MKLFLHNLTLVNFKGAKHQVIDFTDNTFIYGDNKTGKSTIVDGFRWLFLGKDSNDRKDFSIKPLDENNIPSEKIDCEVSAVIYVDGQAHTLKRVLHEKWTKKRGASETEFSGNETLYFWNDVPMSQAEYQRKISGILDEKIFKLITDPLYFSQSITWQERRNVLMEIAGNITDVSIAAANPSFKKVEEILNSGKTLDEYKREIGAKKKKIKEQLEFIPTRVDEANRSRPEAVDFAAVETEIGNLQAELETVRESILDQTKADQQIQEGQRKIQQDIFNLQRSGDTLKNDLTNELLNADRDANIGIEKLQKEAATFNSQVLTKQSAIDLKKSEIERVQKSIDTYETERNNLREKWNAVNSETFKLDSNETCCPTCKRDFDADRVETIRQQAEANYNADKTKRLTSINQQGVAAKETQERYKTQLANLNEELATLESDHANLVTVHNETRSQLAEALKHEVKPEPLDIRLERALASSTEYQKILSDIQAKQHLYNNAPKAEISQELKQKELSLNASLIDKRSLLSRKEQIEKVNDRVNELIAEEKKLAQELTELEGSEYTILQLEKAKVDEIERRINGRFSFVKFKLFREQINGGEEPCCEPLINGVPFADANTAAKMQAGIDIINTLSAHYDVSAPIFLDNRESVVNIPETSAQIVSLFVVEGAQLSVGHIKYKPGYEPSLKAVA